MNALLVTDGDGEEFVREGPGAYLKAAREARGWDLTYIAGAMHLDEETIVALESDDFEELISPVFVQGYLRKYARLIDEPSEPLLRAYRDRRPKEENEPRQDLRAASGKPEMHSNHAFVRIITFVILFLMLGLLVVWWQGYLRDAEPGFMDRAVDRINGEESPADPTVFPGMAVQQEAPPDGISDIERPFTYTVDDEGESPEAEANGGVAADGGETQPDPATATTETAEAGESPATETETAEGEPAGEEGTAEAATGSDGEQIAEVPTVAAPVFTIDFHFDRNSWVDVRDGNGKLLVVGEKTGGSSEQVNSGKPPFSVVLGRANAVRVEVNGEPFDLAPHSRKNVARFKISSGELAID
jgi:cytoskeleton protein RodZ